MLMRTAIHPTSSRHPVAVRGRNGVPAPHALGSSLDLMGAPMPFARNVEIYGENEPAEYIYKVVSGAVRTYRVLNDGRRQIGAFLLPGDMFGLEAGETHACSAEAIADSVILVIKRSAVVALAERDIGNSTASVAGVRAAISKRNVAMRSCAFFTSTSMWFCTRPSSRAVSVHN